MYTVTGHTTDTVGVCFTETKKMLFSCIHSSIVPEWKLTSFAVETPLG